MKTILFQELKSFDYYNLLKSLVIPLNLILLVSFGLFYYNLLPAFYNIYYIFYIILALDTLFLALKLNKLPESEKENSTIFFYSKYFFLLSLAVIVLNQFLKRALITELMPFIIGLSISLGFLTLYASRERVEKEIEDENTNEQKAEEKRKGEFDIRFPKLNKFNIGYGVAGNWRNSNYILSVLMAVLSPFVFIARLPYSFVKWMYKEGWWYSVGLLLIVLLSLFVYSYHLSQDNFKVDEFVTVATSANYYYVSDFFKWDFLKNESGKYTVCAEKDQFCYEDRALPHRFLVAQSYKLFGISEFSTRIVSVMFGVIFIILTYFFVKFFFNNKILAVLCTFVVLLYPEYIKLFRYGYMYSMLIPFYMITSYFAYKTLVLIDSKRVFINNLVPLIIFLYISYKIHINALSILLIMFLYSIYLYASTRKRFYLYFVLSSIFIGLVIIEIPFLKEVFFNKTGLKYFLTFFTMSNYSYLDYITIYPLNKYLGIVLLFLSAFVITSLKNKKIKNPLVFVIISVLFQLFFLIFIANRYTSLTYISHIINFSIYLITSLFVLIIIYISRKFVLRLLLFVILFVFVFYSFIQYYGIIYSGEHNYAQFSQDYRIILDNFKNNETILGWYIRDYYLSELSHKEINNVEMSYFKGKPNAYSFDNFLRDLNKTNSGFVTWESGYAWEVPVKIREYANKNFIVMHSPDKDKSKSYVYYYNQTMIN